MTSDSQNRGAQRSPLVIWRQWISRWGLAHSMILVLVGYAGATLIYRAIYATTDRAISEITIAGDLPQAEAGTYERFKSDLVHRFHGTTDAPYADGVSLVSPVLFSGTGAPSYSVIEVAYATRPLFGGLAHSPRNVSLIRERWAVSLSNGPNVYFRPPIDYRKIAEFLSFNSIKLTTTEEATNVRNAVNRLCIYQTLDMTEPARSSPTRWRVGKVRDQEPAQIFNVNVSASGVIETGFGQSEEK